MTVALNSPVLKLLMIEDDRHDYLLTKEMLSEVSAPVYEIDWVQTYDAGVEALHRGLYDACLVDYRLGAHTGLDYIQAAGGWDSKVPILLLTGQQEGDIDSLALKLGAADFLVKGKVEGKALDRAVRFSIQRHQLLRAAASERARLASFGGEVGRALTRAGTPAEVLKPCAAAMVRTLAVHLAQIHVFNPKRGELTLTASEGILSVTPPNVVPAAVDFIQGEPFLSDPALEDHRLGDREWMIKHQIASAVTYPMFMNDHLLGLITLYSPFAIPRKVIDELGSVAPGIASYLARLALEAQIRRTQQLDCVGKMAAGLAHEFKNNLMVIKTHVDRAMEACSQTPNAKDRLHLINEVTDSATHLAQQLMLFARPQNTEPEPLDIHRTLERMRPMIQGALDQRVSLHLQFKADRPVVEADRSSLQQVIINLAVNARDAMPQGGSLTIGTDNVVVDHKKAATNPDAVIGRFLHLAVSDTGCGMSPETLSRLFEPFFTTKEPGKGNGLGLATVFNIVRQHRGWIEVSSELRVGTTFHIYLPESTREVPKEATANPSNSKNAESNGCPPVQGNRQSVLVVEDEPVLREVAEETLKRANFEVTVAASGQEALRLWGERGGRFDVLLTDLSMPEGITGVQLASELLSKNPELKVILTSGYAPEMVESELGGRSAMFLAKPYPPSLLPETVHKCLGI